MRKSAVGYNILIWRGKKASLYTYIPQFLAFHSHLTSLQLCSSVPSHSFTDKHAFGIQDWRN